MSDPASVLISTAALLAVAVTAGAYGSLRARVDAGVEELERLRARINALEGGAAKAASDRAKDRAAIVSVRLIVRRVRRALGVPAIEEPEPDPIGFRPP